MTARAHPERDLQQAVARLLDVAGFCWLHPENERQCNVVQGAIRKRVGVKAGIPDVLIFDPTDPADPRERPYSGVAIELKAPRGITSPAQLEWLTRLGGCEWSCHICRSIDEVIAVLKRHYPGRIK